MSRFDVPHEKYVPILVEFYQLSQRAGKATPESTQMDLKGPPEEALAGGQVGINTVSARRLERCCTFRRIELISNIVCAI